MQPGLRDAHSPGDCLQGEAPGQQVPTLSDLGHFQRNRSVLLALCYAQSLSHAQLSATPWTVAPLRVRFPKQIGAGCHFLLQGISRARDGTTYLVSPALGGRFCATRATCRHNGLQAASTRAWELVRKANSQATWNISCPVSEQGAFLVAQLVKNLPAMQETLVQFLDQEDWLEKE